MSEENKKWLSEYEAFLKSEGTDVPPKAVEDVYSVIGSLLNPNAWNVFFKILMIHLGVGLLSLSVCHQFGMNPFGTQLSIDRWVMATWGHGTCMIVCGLIFTGASILSAGMFLSIEEIKALRRTGFIQTLALGSASLAVFFLLGAELALSFTGLWLLGALIGGFLAAETLWKFKTA